MANSSSLVDNLPVYFDTGLGRPTEEHQVVIDTINTDFTLKTGVVGQRFFGVYLLLTGAATANVILKSGSSKSRTTALTLNSPVSGVLFITKDGEDFKIQSDTAATIIVQVVEVESIRAGAVLSMGLGSGGGGGGSFSGALTAGEAHVGTISPELAIVSSTATMTRPADTTAYAIGDLVANSTTAGSVTPFTFAVSRVTNGLVSIIGGKIEKSTTSVTSAFFRLHLYQTSPTVTNGDNAAWLSIKAGYLGALDITVDRAFSDGASGIGVPVIGSEIIAVPASGTVNIFGLLEARGAYTPGNAETFLPSLRMYRA